MKVLFSAIEFRQPPFYETPEALNPVDEVTVDGVTVDLGENCCFGGVDVSAEVID